MFQLNNVSITNRNGKRKLETEAQPSKKIKIEEENFHYVFIKDLSALLNKQLSKNSHKKHFCDRCLQYFVNKDLLAKYEEYCATMNKCKIRMPDKEHSKISFKN